MRNPFRAAVAALARPSRSIGAALLAALLLAAAPLYAAVPPPPWIMTLQQVGPDGGAVGVPTSITCPSAGCEGTFRLIIGEATHTFHIQVTLVATGAYLTLVQRSPGIRAVMNFDTGYKGPIFVPLRHLNLNTQRVKLLVAGAHHPGDPMLASGPVFNTRLRPDAYLQVVFQRAKANRK